MNHFGMACVAFFLLDVCELVHEKMDFWQQVSE